jgi:hypothetical protein
MIFITKLQKAPGTRERWCCCDHIVTLVNIHYNTQVFMRHISTFKQFFAFSSVEIYFPNSFFICLRHSFTYKWVPVRQLINRPTFWTAPNP